MTILLNLVKYCNVEVRTVKDNIIALLLNRSLLSQTASGRAVYYRRFCLLYT